jgi:histidine triad (HIT) family protein
MDGCVFCGIVSGKIPSTLVFEDDFVVVFPDIHKQAPLHLLVVPKVHVGDLAEATTDLVAHIHKVIKDKVVEMGLEKKGYRIVINGGTAKVVPHLHFHLLGDVKAERVV